MARPSTATRNSRPSRPLLVALGPYALESQRPLAILAFLTPFIIAYELGIRLFPTEVTASHLLRRAAELVNVSGRGVPAVLLIATLLIYHLARQDRWQLRLATLPAMLLESLILALPVFAIGIFCSRSLPLLTPHPTNLGQLWILSLGAGIYEELLFRFYGCGAIKLLCERGLRLSSTPTFLMVVLVSSIAFSLYHYLGVERFSLVTFVYRTLAGAYFAIMFMHRGLGITAGAHAIYDLMAVTLSRS